MSKFEKISFGQYIDDVKNNPIWNNSVQSDYDDIILPKRATVDSAGYDIFAPFDITLKPGEYTKFPLGIKWVCEEKDINKVLMIVPRSGLGFKFGVRLVNTVGIIDSFYCKSDNEGHIWAKLTADKEVTVQRGKAILQGIILSYDKTDDDNSTEKRNGGFGSTDKKENR